eukprot:CAMPEP_0174260120 /NCGR_PEP_ID=MMETSP0439-20130205/8855_1 /TAXON_ID=0 /ORGANISM="Stereomyxa ramosa, Strain Chinc5" /LENGTH=2486 /DNA_ID=CAMNT_0015344291 /DNA_START=51 /DNA_END=7511 /DNA_ORIENTATION=-
MSKIGKETRKSSIEGQSSNLRSTKSASRSSKGSGRKKQAKRKEKSTNNPSAELKREHGKNRSFGSEKDRKGNERKPAQSMIHLRRDKKKEREEIIFSSQQSKKVPEAGSMRQQRPAKPEKLDQNKSQTLRIFRDDSGRSPTFSRKGEANPTVNTTAADFIFKSLLGEFKELAKRKIEELMDFSVITLSPEEGRALLSDFFDEKEDPIFGQLVESLALLSRNCAPVLIRALLNWRSSQHFVEVNYKSKLASYSLGKLNDNYTLSLLKERHALATDYIFCTTLLRTFQHCDPETALQDDFICNRLESISFEHLKPVDKNANKAISPAYVETLIANRKAIPKLYAQILGVLSIARFSQITEKFFSEIKSGRVRSTGHINKCQALVRGMNYLRLQINTQAQVNGAIYFLTENFKLLKLSKNARQMKPNVAKMFVLVTQDLREQPPNPNISYKPWYSTVETKYNEYLKKITKTAFGFRQHDTTFHKTWYPLLTALLCLTSRSFFVNNVKLLAEQKLIQLLKDKSNKDIALKCIRHIVHTDLVKYSDPDQNRRVEVITSAVFPSTSNWKTVESVSMETYVDIICIIANKKLDYVMSRIVFDLLRVERDINVKRVTVGIQVLLKLSGNLKANRPDSVQIIPSEIQPSMNVINDLICTLLTYLDQSHGRYILPYPAKHNIEDVLQKEKHSINLLRMLINCFPFCMPSRSSASKFFKILSRYLVHIDKGIRENAHAALSRIMNTSPNLRSDVISAVAYLPLKLPDSAPKLLFHVLHKLSALIHQWSRIKTEGVEMSQEISSPRISTSESIDFDVDGDMDQLGKMPPVASHIIVRTLSSDKLDTFPNVSSLTSDTKFDPSQIEAIALVFLCSPYPYIRVLSTEILQAVRTIVMLNERTARGSEGFTGTEENSELPSARIMDIIDEIGPDVISRLQQDFRFRMLNKAPPSNAKTLEKLWSSENREDQICWTYCLGALLPLSQKLCPRAVNLAWGMVCTRMNQVKPDEKQALPLSLAREKELFWWRNYIVFTCATVTKTVCYQTHQQYPEVPKKVEDLFSNILLLLKSDIHRSSVVMALERTNRSEYDTLFEAMRPLHNVKRKKKLGDELRNQISFIYSYISENMKQTTLAKNENMFMIFLGYIQETKKALQSFQFILDNYQSLRYNFCVIVGNVAQNLSTSSSNDASMIFDPSLRKDLFKFLLNWCRGEAMLQDDVCKRGLNRQLGEISDEAKKKAYEKVVKEQIFVLQHAACSAAAALLLGEPFDEEALQIDGPVFTWINSLLMQTAKKKLHAIAITALEGFLQNTDYPILLETCIYQCYSTNQTVSRAYFLALVELYKVKQIELPLPVLFTLIILKAGESNVVIRKSTVQLLQLISEFSSIENMTYDPLPTNSLLDYTYRRSQYELSQRLAKQHPDLVVEFTTEIVRRLDFCLNWGKNQLLYALIPWIQQINNSKVELEDSQLQLLLQNLLIVTHKYADEHHNPVQKIWTTLAAEDDNISLVIDFLLNFGIKKRNPGFIPLAKKIILFFGRTSSQVTVDTLVNELSLIDTDNKKKDKGKGSLGKKVISPPFSVLMPDVFHYTAPARGHLALIFLAELAYEIKEEFLCHLPVILHQNFLGFDNQSPVVYEHCRALLLNLIDSLVVQRLESTEEDPEDFEEYEEALELQRFLKSREQYGMNSKGVLLGPFWNNEDISLRKIDIQSSFELQSLVKRVVSVFNREESLIEDWATEALSWAISCPSHHLANRSYQMYRALLPCSTPTITPIDMLESMYKRCKKRTKPNISVCLEILITLQAMVDTLDSKLWLFPQVFWTAVALLHSDYKQEYLQAGKLLYKLITRFSFADAAVQNVFLTGTPTDWDPPFVGLQPLVTRGLFSEMTADTCVELLSIFTLMPCPQVFQKEPLRLLTNILGLVPWLSLQLREADPSHRCFTVFANLAEACAAQECLNGAESELAEVFTNCQNGKYKSEEEFFENLSPPLAMAFFPNLIDNTFTFLFDLLERGPAIYHKALMVFTKYLLLQVDLSSLDESQSTQWLSIFMSRFVASNSLLWRDGLSVLESIVNTSSLSVINIYQNQFEALSYHQPPDEFSNELGEGNIKLVSSLKSVLESDDNNSSHRPKYFISPEFFETFFHTEASEEVQEDVIDSTTSESRSPMPTYVEDPVEELSDDDLDDLSDDFQDIFGFFAGPPMHAEAPPVINNFAQFDDFIESHGEEENKEQGLGDFSTVKKVSRMDSCIGEEMFKDDELIKLRRHFRKLSEFGHFKSGQETKMFEIFPVAGKLVTQLQEDFRKSLKDYISKVPPSDPFTIISSPVLQAKDLDKPMFQQPIPDAKPNGVLFSLVCSKYRGLSGKKGFGNKFNQKRMVYVEGLNQQIRVYFQKKVDVQTLLNNLPEVNEETELTLEEEGAIIKFVGGVVKLHYHLLNLARANACLQALVNGILETSNAEQPQLGELEEEVRITISTELSKNRAFVDELAKLKEKNKKKKKKAWRKST